MSRPPALTFSQANSLITDGTEEWFDPCLVLDTPLCIDPFLMLDLERDDEFQGAHHEILTFFQRQFERIADSGANLHSQQARRVVDALRMPEASELCLGYSMGTRGAGTGAGLAELMAHAMISSIALGLKNIRHFEEISILGNGIGPDRISDATAGITKWRFAKYTERICEELGVPLTERILDRAKYDLAQDRWITVAVRVPINPSTGKPVLITPQRFLRHLPTLGSDEFAKFAQRRWREHHRDALARRLVTFDRELVLERAKQDERVREEFITFASRFGGKPYDFQRDRWGVQTPKAAASHVQSFPFQFSPPRDDDEMKEFVVGLARYFKHFIEEQKGWELLWDGTRPKPEKAVQRLVFGIVFLICRMNDVSVDPETNAGRGPVDFKFSHGFKAKCLLETKLSTNSKWLRSILKQLPTYIVSDVGKTGVYLLVSHGSPPNDVVTQLTQAAQSVASKGIDIDVLVVDAGKQMLSASKM